MSTSSRIHLGPGPGLGVRSGSGAAAVGILGPSALADSEQKREQDSRWGPAAFRKNGSISEVPEAPEG